MPCGAAVGMLPHLLLLQADPAESGQGMGLAHQSMCCMAFAVLATCLVVFRLA